ncbi:hypothetical protein [Acidocella aromatica]|uniref:hypothetical protein n=1 Tax=Acidocella aromatica TaxID=1303579 RepID=UPI001605E851|nr:hypothetical protein [Acidocella aromatica]
MLYPVAGVMVCATLVGCTPPPLAATVVYDHTGGKVIDLPTPYAPDQVALESMTPITTAGTVGVLFGPLGGALGAAYDQSVQQKRQAAFDTQLAQRGFVTAALLQQQITRQLQAEGYTVVPESVTRPKGNFLDSYPAATPAAPQLDVVLEMFGYLTAGMSSPYQPMVEMKYRLVGQGGKTLAQGAFQYSCLRGEQKPDPSYDYQTYSALAADPSLAMKGLTDGLNRAAGAVAKRLN